MPRRMWSSSRPGVATSTCTPRRRSSSWRFIAAPPTIGRTRTPIVRPSGASASVTCRASSRVGTSTKPSGRPGRTRAPASLAISGRPNASVLPEPVEPRPRTSRPARTSGIVAAWIGKASVMPCRSSAVTMACGRPSSANGTAVEDSSAAPSVTSASSFSRIASSDAKSGISETASDGTERLSGWTTQQPGVIHPGRGNGGLRWTHRYVEPTDHRTQEPPGHGFTTKPR